MEFVDPSPPRRIISASRRSDIPAFYTRWLLERLEAGFCEWIHPFGGSVQRVSLQPRDCLAIVLWTRNPAPLLPHIADIRGAGHVPYFHVTVTGYPRLLETHVPDLDGSTRRVQKLATAIGPESVVWRYDPIVLSSLTPVAFHVETFTRIAAALEGSTRAVYFSFLDVYGKTRRNLERLTRADGVAFQAPDPEEKRSLVHRLRDVADRHGMRLFACCEDDLVGDGIAKGRCVDIDAIRALRSGAVVESQPRRPTRKQCGCTQSVDIGAYDTCVFGCAYCYATNSRDVAARKKREHDPHDTLVWRPPRLHE